ncbi:MAG TPA: hypothetical protein DCW44_08375 [Eubacterium sp.]|nr:hypothetical protein [Eubacterium sp.]
MRKLMKNKKNRIRKRIISGTVAFALVMSSLLPGAYSGNTNVVGETTAKEEKVIDGSKITKDEFDKLMENHKVGDTIKGIVDGLTSKELEVKASKSKTDKVVSLEGLMPEDAKGKVTDVTSKYQNDTKASDKKNDDNLVEKDNVVAAYDISIMVGKKEYQPGAKKPIRVEIKDKRIIDNGTVALFHISDDGERQRILDFNVVDGAISFKATGFSVYEIVDGLEAFSGSYGWTVANSFDKLDEFGVEGENNTGGFHIGNKDNYFLTGGTVTNVTNDRSGLAAASVSNLDDLESGFDKFYIEKVTEGQRKYYIYKKNGDTKQYLKLTSSTGNNASRGGLVYATQEEATAFTFTLKNDGTYSVCGTIGDGTTEYYLNKNTKNPGNGAIVAYASSSDANNYYVKPYYYKSAPDDPYGLNGKSSSLMRYNGGRFGNALIADGTKNFFQLSQLLVKDSTDNEIKEVYLAEETDITKWTFHSASDAKYKLSATVNGETKYLKIDGSGVSLVDEADASKITLTPGSGINSGKISLSSGGNYLVCNVSGYNGNATGGYGSTTNASNEDIWLNFVEKTQITAEDQLVSSAKEVSVSDKTNVTNGTKVIIYTRKWNNKTNSYDFYAIDHDGSLYPCFERGDAIMWIGDASKSLEWEFTEYYWEGTTNPNYYYELYNPYSGKYLAPQLSGNQILSDDKIGINLEGRRNNEFYTEISAWDELHYTFASVKNGDDAIESGPVSKADTYYFALANPAARGDKLRKADTIDGTKYGIEMKMIDWGNNSSTNASASDVTKNYIGSYGDERGLLSTDLKTDGYPRIVKSGAPNVNFGEAFEGATNVNHLFLKSVYDESGYFEFDSCQNFATLLDENGQPKTPYTDAADNQVIDFTVYKELGTMNGTKSSLQHGQFMPYNIIKPEVYSTNANEYSALADYNNPAVGKLSDDDPRKHEKLYLIENPNYYNGMEMSAKFTQTPSGKDLWGHDIIFEFTGDDDFWLYVDGELVVDLGGVHRALSATVNYSTGKVVVDGKETTLKDIFYNNMIKRGETKEAAQAVIDEKFEKKNGHYVFKDYSEHDIRIFYMERGGGASNLHMRMNLTSVEKGNVVLRKELSGSDADEIDKSLVKYPYQIYYKLTEDGVEHLLTNSASDISVTYQNSSRQVEYAASYTPPGCEHSYNSVYFISPERNVDISFPDNAMYYRIVECGINTEVYDHVYVNGTEVTGESIGNANREKYNSGWLKVVERQSVTFDNHVKENAVRTLEIRKRLYDVEGQQINSYSDSTNENNHGKPIDRTKFNYRLYLTDGTKDLTGTDADDEFLTDRYNYYVADKDGNLCSWNVENQDFDSSNISKGSIKTLTDAQKDKYTFHTSIYGAIANIPADYTVIVPGLQVGVEFMVEEREKNMPKGYQLIDYHREAGSYTLLDGSLPENYGRVSGDESPIMYVDNEQGWGLTVNKVWTDLEFAEGYDPIYVALYEIDANSGTSTLVPGTVRQIKYPDTSAYYASNTSYYYLRQNINLYETREVKISNPNPTIDARGNVTNYGTVTPYENGDKNKIHCTLKKNSEEKEFDYVVSYNQGIATGYPMINNIREDTVTNTREGGVVLKLYSWNDKTKPLAGAKFTLTCDGEPVGEYTTDENGTIVILYGFEKNKTYSLVETNAPAGYIGAPNEINFTITGELGSEVINLDDHNDPDWSDVDVGSSADGIIGYVNVYNKPVEFKIHKYDSEDQSGPGLEGAIFAVYKQLYSSITGYTKAKMPVEGFGTLTTDDEGHVTVISGATGQVLRPGTTYYITENVPPLTYENYPEDMIITVGVDGRISIDAEHASMMTEYEGTGAEEGTYQYHLWVPDVRGTKKLTVTKTVKGAFGNKNKDFKFTFATTTDLGDGKYAWTKNGVTQTTPLLSGSTFKMKDEDVVEIYIKPNTEVTITEDNEDYEAKFKLGSGAEKVTSSMKFIITGDTTLAVTNTRNAVIPTGVWTNYGKWMLLMLLFLGGVVYFGRKKKDEEVDVAAECEIVNVDGRNDINTYDGESYEDDFMKYVEFIDVDNDVDDIMKDIEFIDC